MELSGEQSNVLNEVVSWYNSKTTDIVKVVGYAGTGKTTLMIEISDKIRYNKDMARRGAHRIAFCAYTGKASFVLHSKLKGKGSIRAVDYVGTIHGLLYSPRYTYKNNKKVIIGWEKKDELEYDLIIVDEGSMVTKDISIDLMTYGIPILVCGDHGQLSPIGDNFNFLENPDFKLNEIHRQALGNPIIQLTVDIRRKGFISPGFYNGSVFKLDWNNPQTKQIYDSINWSENPVDVIQLCGFNKTRVELNKTIRKKMDFKLETPYPAERIMCLKNNHSTGIKNGQLGSLVWVYNAGEDLYDLTMQMDGYGDNLHSSLAIKSSFGKDNYNEEMEIDFKKKYASELKYHKQDNVDMFDFGYATTVHKSQGSEWDRVVLFEQRNKYQNDQEYARWLYTAATRAKERLFIIYNYWG